VDENGEDHAYWRQYYGIDRQWTPRPGVRRGCVLGLMAALLIVVVAASILHRHVRRPVTASISTWKAPTDFLLQTPNAKLMKTVPTFGVPKRGTSS